MRAIKAMDLRDKFKDYCELAASGEIFIVTRPDKRNIVVMSEDEFNSMLDNMQEKNFWERIERARANIKAGKFVEKTIEELEAYEH
ncbi:MAG: type II toxin-antitoxin system Phd/YefM family antitoxin [Oscillospiraceae bacterium]|nr:type II toxin-antitoxin system Phd/YefM family antitoxin [Oscillospiraceae bacterium]